MAKLTIDTGTAGNPATGDTLRTAMTKVNANFTEIYNELGSDGTFSNISFDGNTISTDNTNGDLTIDPNGTGRLVIDATITNTTTNSNITISPNGTGAIDVDTSRIINVTDPTSAQDAATKNYVDTQLSSSSHNFTFVGDDSTGTAVTQGETFKFAGTQNITTAVSGDTLTITGPDLSSYATQAYVDARDIGDLSVVGSTISAPSNATLTLTTSGTGNISLFDNTSVQGTLGVSSDITVDGTFNRIGDFTFSGTSISSGSSTAININEQLNVDGALSVGGNITGTFAGTMDADTATVSNIEVDNFKASTIVLESEGIAGNDNDTTLPTSAAVKDYVDTQLSGSSHSITFVGDDSTSTAVTQGETFKIAGTQNITTAVSGDTLTITGPDLSSYLTSETSHADVLVDGDFASAGFMKTDGAGTYSIDANTYLTSVAFGDLTSTPTTLSGYGITDAASSTATAVTVVGDDSTGTAVTLGETFKIAGTQNITTAVSGDTLTVTGPDLTNYLQNTGTQTIDNLSFNDNIISTSSNADLILSPGGTGSVVASGIRITGTSISSDDSSTININEELKVSGLSFQSGYNNIGGGESGMSFSTTGEFTFQGDIQRVGGVELTTVSDPDGVGTASAINGGPGRSLVIHAGNMNDVGNYTNLYVRGADIEFLTNGTYPGKGTFTVDGIQINNHKISTNASNADLELSAAGTGKVVANSPLQIEKGYIEAINTLTSSSTITVDFSTASVHTVTLAENTEFVVTNLPTGGTGTIIITQDGGGSNTGSFGTDGSTAVKFAGGTPTLSTAGNAIDVVTIFNDGTNYLGNIAKAYAA